MNKFLLDTNIITALLRPKERPENLQCLNSVEILTIHADIEFCMPEVSYYESLRGHLLLKLKYPDYNGLDELETLKGELTYIPLTTSMWQRAAEIWANRQYRAKPSGKGIDGDSLLAAQAIIANGTIVTNNGKHFDCIAPWTTLQNLVQQYGLDTVKI